MRKLLYLSLFIPSIVLADDKDESFFIIDIPVAAERQILSIERVQTGAFASSSSDLSWSDNVFTIPNLPNRLSYITPDSRFSVKYELFKVKEQERKFKNLSFELEGSMLKVLVVGLGAVSESETSSGVFDGLNFQSDFVRNTRLARMWTGIKLGKFSQGYFAARYVFEYGDVMGIQRFGDDDVRIILFDDEFKGHGFYIDGRFNKLPSIGVLKFYPNFHLINMHYVRQGYQVNDTERFGNNRFQDLRLLAGLEVANPRYDYLRFRVDVHYNFNTGNSLIIQHHPSHINFSVRLKF